MRVLLFVVLVVTSACAGGAGRQPAGGPPDGPPYISGNVTSVDQQGRTLAVEAADRGNQAVVTVTSNTRIAEEFGGGYEPSNLSRVAVGQIVSVWASGPVRESFPVQLDADVILIKDADAAP